MKIISGAVTSDRMSLRCASMSVVSRGTRSLGGGMENKKVWNSTQTERQVQSVSRGGIEKFHEDEPLLVAYGDLTADVVGSLRYLGAASHAWCFPRFGWCSSCCHLPKEKETYVWARRLSFPSLCSPFPPSCSVAVCPGVGLLVLSSLGLSQLTD